MTLQELALQLMQEISGLVGENEYLKKQIDIYKSLYLTEINKGFDNA